MRNESEVDVTPDPPNPYDAPKASLDDPAEPKRPEPSRFSFVELLVVLAIIGLIVWLLPTLKD